MPIIEEFKKFIMRGNVVDLAVGVIIGGAFGKIVSSFVGDILMPPIGLLLGGVNFEDLKLILKAASSGAPAITLNYGTFIQTTADFLIISAVIFTMIKTINSLQKQEKIKEEREEKTKISREEKLLTEIRDLLKNKNS